MELDTLLRVEFAEKAWPSWERNVVNRLGRVVGDLFGRLASAVMDNLFNLGRTPGHHLARQRVASPFLEATEELFDVLWSDAYEAGRFGYSQVTRSSDDTMPNPIAERLRDHVFTGSRATMDRINGDVMGSLTRSSNQGLGVQGAADDLQATAFNGLEDWQARRVARTELNSSHGAGAYETMREGGIIYHRWVTAEDERVRASHVFLNDTIVRLGDRFPNSLKFPGDRSLGVLTISEWINCRCRSVPYFMPVGVFSPPAGQRFFTESDLEPVGRPA